MHIRKLAASISAQDVSVHPDALPPPSGQQPQPIGKRVSSSDLKPSPPSASISSSRSSKSIHRSCKYQVPLTDRKRSGDAMKLLTMPLEDGDAALSQWCNLWPEVFDPGHEQVKTAGACRC